MFGKNKKDVVAVSTLPLEEFEFLLGKNSILCGNLQTKGASRIDGNFKGIIVSENDVLIGTSGMIEANIFGENVTVAGHVNGNIVARGTLEILASGVLNGDVKAGNLVVETAPFCVAILAVLKASRIRSCRRPLLLKKNEVLPLISAVDLEEILDTVSCN